MNMVCNWKCIIMAILVISVVMCLILGDINNSINLNNQCKKLGYKEYALQKEGLFNSSISYCIDNNKVIEVTRIGDTLILK